MTTRGTFEIDGSFKLTGRGLVIYGDIINGAISENNFLTINTGQQDLKLKIKSVEFLDKVKERISKLGLTFHYNDDKQMEDLQTLQVTKQTATITEL